MPDRYAMLSWATTLTHGISVRSVRTGRAQRTAGVPVALKTGSPERGFEAERASSHREKLTDCSDLTKLPRLAVGVSDMNEFCSNDVDTAGSKGRRDPSKRQRAAVSARMVEMSPAAAMSPGAALQARTFYAPHCSLDSAPDQGG
jgi:hypothetical protein